MINSVLGVLLELKNSFKDSCLRQSSVIAAMLDNEATLANTTINSGAGKAYNMIISKVPGSELERDLSFTIFQSVGSDITQTIRSTETGDFDFDIPVDGLGVNLSEVVNDLESTMDFNTTIVQCCNMFCQTQNASLDALFKYIDNSTDNANGSVRQFKQMLAANCPDGVISQFKFLSILKNIMKDGENELENGSLTMNTNSAYFIANAIGTVLASVASTVLQVVGSLLAIVGGIVLKIVGVIASAVGTILSKINQQVRTNIRVKDPMMSYPCFDGVAEASVFDTKNDRQPVFHNAEHNDVASNLQIGPFDTFFWAGPSGKGLSLNNFFCMCLHPERTMSWLYEFWVTAGICNFTINGYGSVSSLEITWSSYPALTSIIPDECYLTTEELIQLGSADDATLTKYAAFMMAMVGCILMRPNIAETLHFNVGTNSSDGSFSISMYNSIVGSDKYKCIEYCIDVFFDAFACWLNNSSLTAWSNKFSSSVGETLTQIAIDFMQNSNSLAQTINAAGSMYYLPGDKGLHAQKSFRFNVNYGTVFYYQTVAAILYIEDSASLGQPVEDLLLQVNLRNKVREADAIPTVYSLSFANTRWSEIITALAVVTVVAVASICITAIGKVKLKKWSVKKQGIEWSRLQEARSHWIDPDSGQVIGSDADYQKYYKAIKRYNRYGRWLGFGSYDPVNNWNNAPEEISVVSGDANANTPTIDQIDSVVTDVNNVYSKLTGSTQTSPEDITLNTIKTLITG